MINVSTYWTLPPSRQGKIRQSVAKEEQELQRVVGHYYTDSWLSVGVYLYFTLYCSKCYIIHARDDRDYTPLTKEQYLDKNHDMHGETCEMCKKPLA